MTMTPDEKRDAVRELLGIAYGNQEFYLRYGLPDLDYGSDPEPRSAKAATLERFGQLGEEYGLEGELSRWTELRDRFLAATSDTEL